MFTVAQGLGERQGIFLSLTADRCQLNVGRHLDSRETDMNIRISGAGLIGPHAAQRRSAQAPRTRADSENFRF